MGLRFCYSVLRTINYERLCSLSFIHRPTGREERFAAYRSGINEIIAKVHASGAKLVLMTPPAFDALPLKTKATPADGALLALVSQRQKVLHDAWLSEVGHLRPAVKPGLPIDQAKSEMVDIDKQINARLNVILKPESR